MLIIYINFYIPDDIGVLSVGWNVLEIYPHTFSIILLFGIL